MMDPLRSVFIAKKKLSEVHTHPPLVQCWKWTFKSSGIAFTIATLLGCTFHSKTRLGLVQSLLVICSRETCCYC